MILVLTVAFGLAGGGLVIPIVDLDWQLWVVVVAGAATLSTLVAFFLLTGEHRPRRPASPAATTPAPIPVATPSRAVEPSGQWWTQPGKPANNTPAARPPDPVPQLTTYVATGAALVAQCPNCGDFRLDVTRGEPTYSFRCHNPRCRHAWVWTPGTDWPAVVVRRNLTGEPTGPDRH